MAGRQIIEDLSTWQLHIPEAKHILEAIRLQEQYKISFWDAMIITSVLALECRVLWSEDLSTAQNYEGMKIVNPFANM